MLGATLNIMDAFNAITIASLIFAAVTFGVDYNGLKEGLSGTLIARYAGFG